MTNPVDLNIRPVIHQPIYAEGYDHRPTRRDSDAASDPFPWRGIATAGLWLVVAVVLIGTVALFLNSGSFTCDSSCWKAKAQVGVAYANAQTGVPSSTNNGDVTADTIVGVAKANASARMGSNSGSGGVNAVKPDIVAPAPAPEVRVIYPDTSGTRIVYAPQAPVVQRPVYASPTASDEVNPRRAEQQAMCEEQAAKRRALGVDSRVVWDNSYTCRATGGFTQQGLL